MKVEVNFLMRNIFF